MQSYPLQRMIISIFILFLIVFFWSISVILVRTNSGIYIYIYGFDIGICLDNSLTAGENVQEAVSSMFVIVTGGQQGKQSKKECGFEVGDAKPKAILHMAEWSIEWKS